MALTVEHVHVGLNDISHIFRHGSKTIMKIVRFKQCKVEKEQARRILPRVDCCVEVGGDVGVRER